MELYLVDVKSTVTVSGKDVALDYINTYTDFITASNYAMSLTSDKDVLDVSIHKWIFDENGDMQHSGDILYQYHNDNHRETYAWGNSTCVETEEVETPKHKGEKS